MLRKFIFSLSVIFLLIPAGAWAAEQPSSPIKESFDIQILQPGVYFERTAEERAEGGRNLDIPPAFVFIRNTVNFLTAIVGSFSLLVFVIGSIYLLISEGQEDRIQKGKQAMTFSLIGLVIALMAYVITTIVQSIFF